MINFDAVIRQWLNYAEEDRSPQQGALILLKIDRNRVFYNAAIANPEKYLPKIEEKLKSHLTRREEVLSEEEKEFLVAVADKIMENKKFRAMTSGKRADHDSLPPEIQKLYEENLDLRRRRSQYHTQIQLLRTSKADCSKEDLKDIVDLLKQTDIKYRKNWKQYDSFGK